MDAAEAVEEVVVEAVAVVAEVEAEEEAVVVVVEEDEEIPQSTFLVSHVRLTSKI